MAFDFDKYVKRSAKDAFSRMSDDISNKLQDAATNGVSKILGKGLKLVGLSDRIANDVTSRFADAVKSELASEWYNNADPVLNRITGEGIALNRAPEKNKALVPNYAFKKQISTSEDSRGGGQGIYKYPENEGQYYCQFIFRDYQRPAPGRVADSTIRSNIFLPIPRNLVETHGIRYDTPELGAVGGIADQLLHGGGSMGTAVGATVGDILLKNLEKINVLGTDAGNVASVAIQQAYNFALNPHLSVLFKGGSLRKHTFRWIVAPETPEESAELYKIINQFRVHSLPRYIGSNQTSVFEYPAMCTVKFYPWASTGGKSDLYTIKQCMVENVMINYAPNGIPSFFAGTDLPTMIEFEIQLQEIEYLTAEDFGGSNSGRDVNKLADLVSDSKAQESGKTDTAGDQKDVILPPGSIVQQGPAPKLTAQQTADWARDYTGAKKVNVRKTATSTTFTFPE